uniref:Secreted protein n=1 Tax=Rhabditophanes sp. KR3021 TaxID=114890 RepID=A0AC35TP35_9BILA
MISFAKTSFAIVFLGTCIAAKDITIMMRENITTSCPNMNSEVVDADSIKFKFNPIPDPSTSNKDSVTFIAEDGKQSNLRFPGCYKVDLSFKVKKPIVNPYIEAFFTMGTNLPCRQYNNNQFSEITNICTNITQSNWCPESQHNGLRGMLQDKNTCKFCNLCGSLDSEEEKIKKYVNSNDAECETGKNFQKLSFKMCTPTQKELREGDSESKLSEYWSYLKQGVLTAVVHVIDRTEMESNKMRQCQKMCHTTNEDNVVNESYGTKLFKKLTQLCTPKDKHVACAYHTMKFDVAMSE